MAVFNGEPYVQEAVGSILKQSFRDFEFIIVDDASTDGTLDTLARLAGGDDRLRIVRNHENLGQTRSLNRGLEMAKGTFIARQDADDISGVDRLSEQVAHLHAHPDIGLLGTGYGVIDGSGQPVGLYGIPLRDDEIRWKMLFHNAFCHTSVMFRQALIADGGYDENFSFAQDFELWGRLLQSCEGANLETPFVSLRSHPDSVGRKNAARQRELADLIASYHIATVLEGNALPRETVQVLRTWYNTPPAVLNQTDLPVCEWLFRILGAFEKTYSGDPVFLRELRLYWVGNFLAAAPAGLWRYLLRFQPVRTVLLKDGFRMIHKGLNRLRHPHFHKKSQENL